MNACWVEGRGAGGGAQLALPWESPCRTVRAWADANGLCLQRTLFSEQPVFFRVRRDMLVMADDPWLLLEQAADVALDGNWLADYVGYQSSLTARTCFRGVQQLRRGETLVFAVDDRPSSRFGITVTDADRAAVAKPRTALEQAVRGLGGEGCAFHVSAGLDASLLALLARRSAPRQQVHVATCLTRGKGASDEIEIVERLATAQGFELHLFDFRDCDLFAAGSRLARNLRMPLAHPSNVLRLLLDEALVGAGFGQIVTGRGADETFAGYAWHLPRCIGADHHDRVRATREEVVNALLPGETGTAPVRYESFFDAHGYALEARQRYDLAVLGNDWCFIEQRLGASLGVRYASPFATTTVQAAAFALPEAEKVADGVQKVALRRAFADVYPDYLLTQPKRGLTMDVSSYLRDFSVAEIIGRLRGEDDVLASCVDYTVLTAMLDDTLCGRSNFGWQVWSLYLAAESMRHARHAVDAAKGSGELA